MAEEQVKVFCRSCPALIATFDDIVFFRKESIMFVEKACNVQVTDEGDFMLLGTRMGCLYCKCNSHIGVGPVEPKVSGVGANANYDDEIDEVYYGLLLDKVVLMRGDRQIETKSSEAAALMEEGCKRNELAKEKGKRPAKRPVAVDEVERKPYTDDIGTQFRTAVKRLRNIERISESIVYQGRALEVAKLGVLISKQVPELQSELRGIELKLARTQMMASAETYDYEEVTRKMQDIERMIRTVASVIGGLEKQLELAAGISEDAPEMAPGASSSKATMGEGASGSKEGTELAETHRENAPEKEPGESGTAIGSNATTEQAAAEIGQQLHQMGLEFAETGTEESASSSGATSQM